MDHTLLYFNGNVCISKLHIDVHAHVYYIRKQTEQYPHSARVY
jgi:hypothetical protein